MDISIHDVKNISMREIKTYDKETNKHRKDVTFYTKKIIIETEEGKHEITLFSEDKTVLSVDSAEQNIGTKENEVHQDEKKM